MEGEQRPRRICALKQIEKTHKEIAREQLNRIQCAEIFFDNASTLDDADDDNLCANRRLKNSINEEADGREMFNFASESPMVKMDILKEKNDRTPRKRSSARNNFASPTTKGTPRRGKHQAVTPSHTRKQITRKLGKLREEVMQEKDDSSDSEDESDQNDEDSEDGLDREDAAIANDAESFFAQNGRQSKVKTTEHTLSKLGASLLDDETIDKILAQQIDTHSKYRKKLLKKFEDSFHFWKQLTLEGSNLLLYGLGSKVELLSKFSEYLYAEDFIVLIVDGFLPTFSVQEIVSCVFDRIVEKRPKGVIGLQPQLDFICSFFSNEDAPHLFLVINSIDAPPMASLKTIQAFERLAGAPMIHVVASVNHINAPLLWDLNRARSMKWVWIETSTFDSLKHELCSDSTKTSTANTLSSLEHVFASLTSNAKKVFMIIAKYSLERCDSAGFRGMAFQECYRLCREEFIVNSDLTLRAQLTEFVDHDMIRVRKGQDGVEFLVIPVPQEILKIFLEQQNDL